MCQQLGAWSPGFLPVPCPPCLMRILFADSATLLLGSSRCSARVERAMYFLVQHAAPSCPYERERDAPRESFSSRGASRIYYDYEITRMRFRRRYLRRTPFIACFALIIKKKKNTRTRPRVMAHAKPAQSQPWFFRPPGTRFWYWSANQQIPVPPVLCCRTLRVSRITALCKYVAGLCSQSLFIWKVRGEPAAHGSPFLFFMLRAVT